MNRSTLTHKASVSQARGGGGCLGPWGVCPQQAHTRSVPNPGAGRPRQLSLEIGHCRGSRRLWHRDYSPKTAQAVFFGGRPRSVQPLLFTEVRPPSPGRVGAMGRQDGWGTTEGGGAAPCSRVGETRGEAKIVEGINQKSVYIRTILIWKKLYILALPMHLLCI